ncbi:Phage capsid family protein [Rhodobacteraceae bacterium THAF1]|uniref:phage major capsid protein n=1 Tax=Palleronia sp. THAF1 TaxID=2587842 RepID=UPI000F3D7260|nr:phage major capsid protein [Palleronia sp. THAF1]QFU07290.1 Phage capsid family protein [Palleronia sp. THAF1]VDC20798.1 Phage capsid family protein [Rhodobacteraceae bacterium THAF1]
MLDSVKITRRQSEIRQKLAGMAGKEAPSEDEIREMDALDLEYRSNETRYRAALVAEDEERREAGAELETRSDREWSDMMAGFELRQVVLSLDEGRPMDGQTAEIVDELRQQRGEGRGAGIPVPWAALEVRAGETIAAGSPDPIQTRPIIDRLFPNSVAAQMGAQMITIDSGEVEWPVVTQGATVAWQTSETGNVGAPQAFQTVDKALAPDHTLGVQMRLTRKSLKQSGAALEDAVRRDMNSAIGIEMDRVVFLGSGADGEPLGVIPGASTYGITETAVDAAASYAAFRAAAVRFMLANTATGTGAVNLMLRPEIFDSMDELITGLSISEWDRLMAKMGRTVLTTNGLAAPAGSPAESVALMTTNAGGVPPIFVGRYGSVDLIRDPFTDAQSGGLRITALATMDVTVARGTQLEILTGLQ